MHRGAQPRPVQIQTPGRLHCVPMQPSPPKPKRVDHTPQDEGLGPPKNRAVHAVYVRPPRPPRHGLRTPKIIRHKGFIRLPPPTCSTHSTSVRQTSCSIWSRISARCRPRNRCPAAAPAAPLPPGAAVPSAASRAASKEGGSAARSLHGGTAQAAGSSRSQSWRARCHTRALGAVRIAVPRRGKTAAG